MDQATFFNTIWPAISAGLIVPLTNWLKSKMPGDWPIRSVTMVAIFNFLSIFLLNDAFEMGMNIEQMIPYFTGGFAVSTGAHSVWKTKTKNVLTGGTQ